jgi:hypothetical protein
MDKLKPCPFACCNGKAEVHKYTPYDEPVMEIRCTRCNTRTRSIATEIWIGSRCFDESDHYLPILTNEWNTRAETDKDKRISELEVALAKARHEFFNGAGTVAYLSGLLTHDEAASRRASDSVECLKHGFEICDAALRQSDTQGEG